MKNLKQGFLLPLALLLLCLSFVSCRDAEAKVLLTIGSYPVSYEEYDYFYQNYRDRMEGDTSDEVIRENVLIALRQKYAYQSLADTFGITLTEDEEAQAQSQFSAYREQYGGEDAFASALAENHLTLRYFNSMLETQVLQEKVHSYLCNDYTSDIPADDATLSADIPLHFYRASQIVILHEEGDDLTENYRLACDLSERIRNGEDFETLCAQYNEDTSMDSHDGYYATEGQLLAAFEDAALALSEGEVSEVVKSDVGYHIIKRLPMEQSYIDAHFEELRTAYRARVFNERVKSVGDAMEIKYYDRYYEYSPQGNE